ncbi:MAG: ZPR1 zinc finger domain-containing protein [Candidatus Nezhaarchaeales archaeon]
MINVETSQVNQFKTNCLACGKYCSTVSEICYEFPGFGKVYLLSVFCEHCGFKHTDVMEISPHHEPSRIIVKVEEPDDINHIVVRSSHATVKMPELGVTITPGPYAQGVITTIEGFLHRAKEIVEFLASDELSDEQMQRCLETLDKLTAAINGRLKFTFIMEDPSGLSTVVPKYGRTVKIIKEPLSVKG